MREQRQRIDRDVFEDNHQAAYPQQPPGAVRGDNESFINMRIVLLFQQTNNDQYRRDTTQIKPIGIAYNRIPEDQDSKEKKNGVDFHRDPYP